MVNEFVYDGKNTEKPQSQSIFDALRAIKENRCQECGMQAKGFVYRGKLAIYYCKECLHEHHG
jgi:ribosomal protein L37AE/L43A